MAKTVEKLTEVTMQLDLYTVKYVPFGGSSYIPLPRFLPAKKANFSICMTA